MRMTDTHATTESDTGNACDGVGVEGAVRAAGGCASHGAPDRRPLTTSRPLTKSQSLALTSMGAALVCVVTSVIKVPTLATSGYVNLGDVLVLFFGFRFGSRIGGFVGGVGSALADFIGGYAFYVPVTLVAKGVEGAIAGVARGRTTPYRVGLGLVGSVFMVATYFVAQYLWLGTGPAMTTLPGNVVQAGVGMVGALLLCSVVPER